jgi:hypothetical protein
MSEVSARGPAEVALPPRYPPELACAGPESDFPRDEGHGAEATLRPVPFAVTSRSIVAK